MQCVNAATVIRHFQRTYRIVQDMAIQRDREKLQEFPTKVSFEEVLHEKRKTQKQSKISCKKISCLRPKTYPTQVHERKNVELHETDFIHLRVSEMIREELILQHIALDSHYCQQDGVVLVLA